MLSKHPLLNILVKYSRTPEVDALSSALIVTLVIIDIVRFIVNGIFVKLLQQNNKHILYVYLYLHCIW